MTQHGLESACLSHGAASDINDLLRCHLHQADTETVTVMSSVTSKA